MKSLFLGILLVILIGIGGLVYRNAVEHPNQKVACPVDAQLCPDGTSVSRVGPACSFPACPPPNVALATANIAFAIPAGFVAVTGSSDPSIVAEYDLASSTPAADATLPAASILIHRYTVDASSTPLAVIERTAISGTSGAPVSSIAFTSTVIGTHRYTVVAIERFEGVVDTAYYLSQGSGVLRFDAIDRGVTAWTDPSLDVSTLPAQSSLEKLLATLQGE